FESSRVSCACVLRSSFEKGRARGRASLSTRPVQALAGLHSNRCATPGSAEPSNSLPAGKLSPVTVITPRGCAPGGTRRRTPHPGDVVARLPLHLEFRRKRLGSGDPRGLQSRLAAS